MKPLPLLLLLLLTPPLTLSLSPPSPSTLSLLRTTNPITPSDLSTAGVPLSTAKRELANLAVLTRGDIAVSNEGDIMYTFPPDWEGELRKRSGEYRVRRWRERIVPPLVYGVKVGFGVVLVVSLVVIFSTIFFVLSSGGGSDREDNRRERRGGFPMVSGFWGPSPFDFFYYRPYYSRYYPSPSYESRDPEEMGFMESVFSYVFGDGDPNGDVKERRLAMAAEMIRENGGAVTAEQLAPFCDEVPLPLGREEGRLGEERAYVDESFVLPIVTELDGEPQVTEEGDIIYTFPELMISASPIKSRSIVDSKEMARRRRESRILRLAGLEEDVPTRSIITLLNRNGVRTQGALERGDLINLLETLLPQESVNDFDVNMDDPTLLQEREYKFSLASSFQTVLAGILGVVNLGGALFLGNLLDRYVLYGVRLPSYMGVVQSFFPVLLAYAVLFNVIPLVRNVVLNRQNEQIRQRNERRRSWKTVLDEKAGYVRRKLAAAARMGKKMRQLGTGESTFVFDTRQDFAEVEAARQADAMREFDDLLGRSETKSWE